jgi:hypothetical protein
MPTRIIRPGENVRLRFRVPNSRVVEYEIESDRPVKSYILRTKGLELFDEGSERFKYYGGFPEARKKQRQELVLPFDEGHWWLLIVNPSKDHSAQVFYDVSF